jgi:5-methylcytosine-specific restriction protein A
MAARLASPPAAVLSSHRKVRANCPCCMQTMACQATSRTVHLMVIVPKPLDRRIRNRESDARRRQERPWRGWYNTPRWQAIRSAQLLDEPLCQRCKASSPPIIRPAIVCHHTIPHKGDASLFWDGPFASSCKECHDTIEQAIEARGYEVGNDINGRPIASDHPWNRPKT